MTSKAIEHFFEYPINWARIQQLPEDQQAAIAVLSYAVSEANALSRLYIFNSHNMIDEEAIDCATSIQRFLLLRIWSAKLFEVEEFLKLGGTKKESKDEDLLELATDALENFSKLRSTEAYPIVRNIRHEATNHYSFKAAKDNLKHVSKNANCSMYLHELSGNSFYPMGEEVMFIGRINRHGASLATKEQKSEQLESWMNWNLGANRWLAQTHYSFINRLIIEPDGRKPAQKRSYWIPPEMAGSREERMAPIFLRKAAT